MPFVIPGGTRVSRGDPDVLFGRDATDFIRQQEEEARLREVLSGFQGSINDPLVRQQLAEAGQENPLLGELLPFDPGVVLRGAERESALNEIAAQQAIEAQNQRLLDELLGPRSVDLGGGPTGTIPQQAPQQGLGRRESLEELQRQGLFDPQRFAQGARETVTTRALEELGIGPSARRPGTGISDVDKMLMRDALQQERQRRGQQFQTEQQARSQMFQDIQRQLGAAAKPANIKLIEFAEDRLEKALREGANEQELQAIALDLGVTIREIVPPSTFGGFQVPFSGEVKVSGRAQSPRVKGEGSPGTQEQPAKKPTEEAREEGVVEGVSKTGRPIISRDGGKTWIYK